jgi:hypothetical protein
MTSQGSALKPLLFTIFIQDLCTKIEQCNFFIVRLVQMKHIWKMFWAKELKPLKSVPMGTEAGSTNTSQWFPSTKKSLGCCWNYYTTTAMASSSDLCLQPFI